MAFEIISGGKVSKISLLFPQKTNIGNVDKSYGIVLKELFWYIISYPFAYRVVSSVKHQVLQNMISRPTREDDENELPMYSKFSPLERHASGVFLFAYVYSFSSGKNSCRKFAFVDKSYCFERDILALASVPYT